MFLATNNNGINTIDLGGNASIAIAANFQLKGNGTMNGAVVANQINLNGDAAFHYDEAVGNITSGNPFGVIKWRELQSSSERSTSNLASHSDTVTQNWLSP